MTWMAIKIRSLCQRIETTDPRRRPDVAFRYIDIAGIDRDLKRISTTAEIMGADAPSRARQVVRANDVLVSTVRPNLNAVAMVPNDLDGEVASTGFCVLRATEQVLDPRFLFYFTRTRRFVNALLQHVRGANYPAVTDRNVHDVEIPWPAKSEQQRIVEILDQADALRQKRRAADEKAQRILPALFHKHIGDPGLNPKNWPLVELSKFGSPLSGGGFPLDEQGHAEGEYPFIKVSDMNSPGNEVYIRSANHWVSGETLQRLRVKAAPAGTTIFPKIGAAVATNKKRLLVQDTAYDNNVIGVVPHKPEWANYIFAFFLLFDLRRLTRTTALPSIKTSELAALPIPKPSDDVIGAFDSQFRQLLSYQEAQRRSAEQINRLFEVLLHRAFSGDLTAKWREANKAQLEAELEQQMAALGEADADSPRRGRKRKAVN